MTDVTEFKRDSYYKALREYGLPHSLAETIVDEFYHACNAMFVGAQINENLRAEAARLAAELAALKHENGALNAENAVIAEPEAVIHDYDARIEQWLKPFPDGETCQECGRAMGIGFHVDDETWARICPDGNTSAVLCPWCADKRAKELGLTGVPATFFIVFDVLRDSQEPYKGAWKQRALNAETELTALKERRCENCCWGQVITTHKPWENSSETYALCFHQDAQIPRVNLALDHRCDHWYSREDTDAE